MVKYCSGLLQLIIYTYLISLARACGVPAVGGRCSGGRLLAMMQWPLFSSDFSSFFFPFFFTFPDPVHHFGAPWRPFSILQAVRRCRRCCVAGGQRAPPSPLGWYLFLFLTCQYFPGKRQAYPFPWVQLSILNNLDLMIVLLPQLVIMTNCVILPGCPPAHLN